MEHVVEKSHYRIGDMVAIQANGPIEKLRLTGTIRLAGAAGMVIALVADRHAQNHYTPGTDRAR